MKIKAILGVFLLVLSIATTAFPATTSAETYNNNKIIENSIFDRSSSMSADQIDSFLNQFPNSCISPNSGFRAIDPTGYSPSGGYTYGGYVTAGRVIADSALAYNINPQVLLATLQKEQSLVIGGVNFCNNGDQNKYAAAVGYGCPDSGTVHNYTGVNLYQRNGVTVTSTGSTCVSSATKAGFSQQVIRGAWLLKFGQQRAEGNVNWAVIKGSWDNSDDPQTCYGGPMTQGTFKRCPAGAAAYYDGYTTIDGTAVHMDNGATAALYWYTPHFHGNQNFFNIFTGWFGSTYYFGNKASSTSVYSKMPCTVGNFEAYAVARLYQPDTGDYLYTSSNVEACYAITLGYIFDGTPLRGIAQAASGAVPVYRISGYSHHTFTTSASQKDSLVAQPGYTYEGIAWYAYGTQVENSQPVMSSSIPSGGNFLSAALGEASGAQANFGYTGNAVAFYQPDDVSSTSPGTTNIYRLAKNNARFYSASQLEKNIAVSNYGYTDEGVLALGDSSPNQNNLPVYRVRNATGYLYTTSRVERDLAVINYNYMSEGVGFYELGWSDKPIFRLTNYLNGLRFVSNNELERSLAVSRYGYNYDGTSWYGY